MGFWKELRTRWMYWRYRNVTRTRQRMQAKMAMRRNRHVAYQAPPGRGVRPVRYSGTSRMARTWILFICAVVGIATLQHYGTSPDLVFLGNIGILAAAYLIWVQLDR